MKKYLSDFPLLMEEWDYDKNSNLDPSKLSHGSHLKVWWKCKKGHKWQALVSNRTRLGRWCPYCSHQKPIIGETDLLSKYPDLCKDWHPSKNGLLTPTQIMPGTHKKVWWKCSKCGHEWQAVVKSRVDGVGCPACAHKTIIKGFNDFGSKYPKIAKEFHPTKNGSLTPYQFGWKSKKKVWWKCHIQF